MYVCLCDFSVRMSVYMSVMLRVVETKQFLFVLLTVSTIVGVGVDEFVCVCFRSLLCDEPHSRLLSLSYAEIISLCICLFAYSVLSIVCCTIHTRSMFVCLSVSLLVCLVYICVCVCLQWSVWCTADCL